MKPLRSVGDVLKIACREIYSIPELQDWKVEVRPLDSAKGLCHYSKQTIRLDTKYAISTHIKYLLNTIRHEIAHALTPYDSHGELWERTAKALGCEELLSLAVRGRTEYGQALINEVGYALFWDRNEIRNGKSGWIGIPCNQGDLELFILHDDKDEDFEVASHMWHFRKESK